MSGTKVGEILQYKEDISMAVIQLCAFLKVGDTVHFLGHGSDFQQKITDMQKNNEPIQVAVQGEMIAVKTIKPVKRNTAVYLISE